MPIFWVTENNKRFASERAVIAKRIYQNFRNVPQGKRLILYAFDCGRGKVSKKQSDGNLISVKFKLENGTLRLWTEL